MAATETLSADEQRLAEIGYKQELKHLVSARRTFTGPTRTIVAAETAPIAAGG
jgi:hypothetical protein